MVVVAEAVLPAASLAPQEAEEWVAVHSVAVHSVAVHSVAVHSVAELGAGALPAGSPAVLPTSAAELFRHCRVRSSSPA